MDVEEALVKFHEQYETNVSNTSKQFYKQGTSLAVSMIRSNHLFEAQRLFKKLSTIDSLLIEQGHKHWEGRLIYYNVLGYLNIMLEKYQTGLQQVYEFEQLSLEIEEKGDFVASELKLTSQLTAFIILWKIQRYKEASSYIMTASQLIRSLYSKHGSESLREIYSLVVVSMAGLLIKTENKREEALSLIEESLLNVRKQSKAEEILQRFAMNLGNEKDYVVTHLYMKLVFNRMIANSMATGTPNIARRHKIRPNKKFTFKKNSEKRICHWWKDREIIHRAMKACGTEKSYVATRRTVFSSKQPRLTRRGKVLTERNVSPLPLYTNQNSYIQSIFP